MLQEGLSTIAIIVLCTGPSSLPIALERWCAPSAFARRQHCSGGSRPKEVVEEWRNSFEYDGPQVKVAVEVADDLRLCDGAIQPLELALLNCLNARDAMPGVVRSGCPPPGRGGAIRLSEASVT